jgi:hypothetical protein
MFILLYGKAVYIKYFSFSFVQSSGPKTHIQTNIKKFIGEIRVLAWPCHNTSLHFVIFVESHSYSSYCNKNMQTLSSSFVFSWFLCLNCVALRSMKRCYGRLGLFSSMYVRHQRMRVHRKQSRLYYPLYNMFETLGNCKDDVFYHWGEEFIISLYCSLQHLKWLYI